MAAGAEPRTSTVVAPRTTRVLRAGGQRSNLADIIVGVVGLLLLLSTIFLANALPKHEVAPPVYAVTFKTTLHEMPAQSFDFARDGNTGKERHDFLFEIPDDNVVEILMTVSFTDDVPASKPDQFHLEAYDPEFFPLGAGMSLRNAPSTAGATPGEYVAVPFVKQLSWPGKGRVPEDTTVSGEADAAVVLAQVVAASHIETKGTWKVNAVFTGGNCITAQEAGGDPDATARMAACQADTGSPDAAVAPQDARNSFTIEAFSYRTFEPVVERIQ